MDSKHGPSCVFEFDEAARRSDPTLQPRWIEWIGSLGLDPNELLPDAAILVDRATNQYVLHVSQVRRKPDGSHWVDEVLLCLVSEPVVVPIGQAKVWPKSRHEKAAV